MRALRLLWLGFIWAACLAMGGVVALVALTPERAAVSPAPVVSQEAARPAEAPPALVEASTRAPPDPVVPANCLSPGYEAAAQINGESLRALPWQPFHRPETGWEIYAPRIAHEIGAACPPSSSGFAAALARWQGAHRLTVNGQMDPAVFAVMSNRWERARPFVIVSRLGVCPAAPAAIDLAWALPGDGYQTKPIQLRPAALAAYRRMVADARAASPEIAADHRLLSIFSGYRSPEADAARCAKNNDCDNVIRATCSAHRTGLAIDLYLGSAPGHIPESSDDINRLYQSRSVAFQWMIDHAGDYGFVNYPYEPWHWEWTGEPR